MPSWEKLGLLYAPEPRGWIRSHAQLPTVDASVEGRWRIYFSSRDDRGRSLIRFVEVAADEPSRLLYEHDLPILSLGRPGSFDHAGIMPGCIVRTGETILLFYTGWSPAEAVPYKLAIGAAVSEDCGRSFRKVSDEPVIGLTESEPLATGSPYVVLEDGTWRCWYFSTSKWEPLRGRLEAVYDIVYAESRDGREWRRLGVAVGAREGEALGRGSVVRDSVYRMWYAFRRTSGFRSDPHRSYRIGYAESSDGLVWGRRDDEAGIDVSDDGWDSEMVAYPYVFDHGGARYMAYNGNGFGRTGFGLAVWR